MNDQRHQLVDLTIRGLRRRWKPIKERLAKLQQKNVEHPLPVRLHRAISWLEAAERCTDTGRLDDRLILLWIGLNALYGRWDGARGESQPDWQSLKRFLSNVMRIDQERRLVDLLRAHHAQVQELFANKYVNRYWWAQQEKHDGRQNDITEVKGARWYAEENWSQILEMLLKRIYFVRCQLVHGAATYGGELNRAAVQQSVDLLDPLLRTFLVIVIDHGLHVDWGDLCYPPIKR